MSTIKEGMYDSNLVLAASATVATATLGTITDLGAGFVEGNMVWDVSSLEIASDTEAYTLILQGGTSATFATSGTDTFEDLVSVKIGAAEVVNGNVDGSTGRYVVPFRNERNGSTFRYVRTRHEVEGDIATGITSTVWLTRR